MKIKKIALLIPLVLLAACKQDPIFTMISSEVEPKAPLISGSPSKMVKDKNGSIYVANGKLWKCAADGRWGQVGGAPSKIYSIAAGEDDVYLLSVDNSDTSVHRLGGGVISNPTGYGMIQGLYSDGGENPGAVYAGAMSGDENYAILKLTGGVLTSIQSIGSPLAGVAKKDDITYFATARNGILRRDSSGTFTAIGGSGYSIAGIINADENIIAVTGSGTILKVDVTNNTITYIDTSLYFTGGLTVYNGNETNGKVKLLLLGVKNDIYDMGYREIDLTPNSDGSINFTLYVPGERASLSTVSGRDRYEATLAKYSVNSLIQLNTDPGGDDGLPALFASTQKDGLWSYRNNEWNAEE
jgi:hypothetical protein